MPNRESRNKMPPTSSCIENVARMLRPLLATSSICTILVISSLLIPTNSILADSPNSPTSASSQNSNQTHLTQQQQQSTSSNSAQTSKTSAADSKSSAKNGAGQQQQVSIVEQQPTDLSSMYVQIPIAEPADTGVPDGVQQTLTSTGETDSNGAGQDGKATSWTGPWPKKFQIGYIKQSDLHQVLIESLKNEPFVALGSPSAATKGGQAQQASTPSPAAARKVAPSPPEVVPQKPVQWPQSGPAPGFGSHRAVHQQPLIKSHNAYHHRPAMQAFRDTSSSLMKPFHMAHNRFHQQMNNFQAHQTRPLLNQQPQKLLPIAGNPGNFHQQQQAQYHFGFPMNSFKNEPIYTINNYPHQEQLDQNSMQLLMSTGQQQQQFGLPAPIMGRPQKSAEFQTSTAWRPVTNGDKGEQMQLNQQQVGGKGLAGQISVGQIQSMSVDYPNLNDGFDDGFGAPTKDASYGGSMNRHPMLNNYLNNLDSNAGNRSARMSPSLQAKMKLQSLSPVEGTKSAEGGQSNTKGGGTKSTGTSKGGQDNTSNLSVNRRRAQNGTSTAPSTSSSAPTTVAPTSEGDFANSSTTVAPNVTTGSSSITTTTAENDTQEPDSEVIDSDTTEPSTTTSSGAEASSQSSGGSSTSSPSGDQSPRDESTTSTSSTTGSPDAGSNQSDNGETEVVTQGNTVQQASAGGLPASSMNDSEPTRTSTVSSTTGSSREDTTPSSGSTPSSEEGAKKGGEVEGSAGAAEALSKTRMNSMSDEALMAASLGAASELGKTTASSGSAATQQLSRSRSSGSGTSSSKRTRSPERLVQPASSQTQEQAASNGGRKTASSNTSNKLITKRPQSSASSRSAKQVSADALGGVKGAKLQAGKSGRKSSKKSGSLGTKAKAAALTASRSASGSARAGLQSERLQQPQVVSMTAAQAQSTAQTLASLLLSRCMSSSSCAHLLDICTTKQAMVPLNTGAVQPVDNSIESASPSSATNLLGPGSNNQSSGAWSMPVGLMSSSIMSLTQSLQADKVLKALPQWKDAIENVVDHDTQTGYTLILPSNEALDRMLPSTIDSWLANSELLSQIIDNHMLDSAETIDFMPNQSGRKPVQSRVIKNKGLQVNQHREKMVTINGKRLVYANQVAPCK